MEKAAGTTRTLRAAALEYSQSSVYQAGTSNRQMISLIFTELGFSAGSTPVLVMPNSLALIYRKVTGGEESLADETQPQTRP